MPEKGKPWVWQFGVAGGLAIASALVGIDAGLAQIVPDDTLGEERSRVRVDPLRPERDLIRGGARRGDNLFHSFERFDVEAGREAYFDPSSRIQTIFGRITGTEPSQILGTLGVLGNADLVLMNPNGVVFGPGSQLDLPGSFLVTTADAIQFRDRGVFSAIEPDVPPLLTVNPSVFLFSQPAPGDIAVNAVTGLQVAVDASLTVLGGDIQVTDSGLGAVDGAIGIVAVGEAGAVNVQPNGRLRVPTNLDLGDLELTNAFVSAGSGDIDLQAGDLTLLNGARVLTSTASRLDAGDIRVSANDIRIDGISPTTGLLSALLSSTLSTLIGSEGDSGDIRVDAETIDLVGGGFIGTLTQGTGDAGDIRVESDRLSIEGFATIPTGTFLSHIFSSAEAGSEGNTGDIRVESDVLELRDSGQVATATFSAGDAGDIVVEGDRLSIEGFATTPTGPFLSSVISDTAVNVEGSSGDIRVEAERIDLRDGGRIETNTRGTGDAGDVRVEGDRLSIEGFATTLTGAFLSAIRSGTVGNVEGSSGNIRVDVENIGLVNGGRIETTTQGTGDAGDIHVEGDRLSIEGLAILSTNSLSSGLRSSAEIQSEGNSGDIYIEAGTISLINGAQISTNSTDAESGNIWIDSGSVRIRGANEAGFFDNQFSSISSTTTQGTTGNIRISTNDLEIYDGAKLSTETVGAGDLGSIQITAETILVEGSSERASSQILTLAGLNEESTTSNIRIFADELIVRDGAALRATSFGPSDAGNIRIRAGAIRIEGGNERFFSGIFSLANQNFEGFNLNNDAGDIRLVADRF